MILIDCCLSYHVRVPPHTAIMAIGNAGGDADDDDVSNHRHFHWLLRDIPKFEGKYCVLRKLICGHYRYKHKEHNF